MGNQNKKDKSNKQNMFLFIFNNHFSGRAPVNSLQFKELAKEGHLTDNKKNVLEKARKYISNTI